MIQRLFLLSTYYLFAEGYHRLNDVLYICRFLTHIKCYVSFYRAIDQCIQYQARETRGNL